MILWIREVLFILAIVVINRYSVKKPDLSIFISIYFLMTINLHLNQVIYKLDKSQFFQLVPEGPIFWFVIFVTFTTFLAPFLKGECRNCNRVMQSNSNNKKIVTAGLIEIQFFGRYGIKKVRASLLNEEKFLSLLYHKLLRS